HYGGTEFACVLGQEMAGYATGEVFFVSQAYGFRHSHLDSAGYGFDQTAKEKDADAAVRYLIDEECKRVQLTCMVSCLFARGVYPEARLQEALTSIGFRGIADSLPVGSREVPFRRWSLRYRTGYDPEKLTIPKRFHDIRTWKGPIDGAFMKELGDKYKTALAESAAVYGSTSATAPKQ
ncbi:MAG: aldehyde ferredoxin oxidoreductase, partial [Pseudomonadota bacterium]